MNKKQLAVVLLFPFGLTLNAQQSLNAGGGEAVGNGSVSYSIGQVFHQTKTDGTFSIAEGVQQPYEIQTLAVNENLADSHSIAIYPNPVKDFLVLQAKMPLGENLTYELYTMQGQQIRKGNSREAKTQIDLANFPSGMYVMVVKNQTGQEIKTFKIIKK